MKGGEILRIQFEFQMEKLPIAYRLGMLSIIKEMIHKGSKQYFHKLFNKNKRELKPFSHATFIRNLQIDNDELQGDRLYLTISSPSYEFIMHLINGSGRRTTYKYKDFSLTLISKRLLPSSPQFTDKVTFKTLSPILIENKERQPLQASDPTFELELNYYATLLAKELFNRNLFQPIKLIGTNMKKVVIKENVHQEQTDNIFFTGNEGLIQLSGDKEDLKLLYDCGIGLRRSLGFGLLDVEGVTYANE